LPVVIVRLFNTVGPRQVGMYGMVLPRFVEAALAGKPLQVYGDGRQTRCFCHVLDVVEALTRLMLNPAAVGGVFNVGSDEEVSINDLARQVIQAAGAQSAVEHITYEQAYGQPFDDMARRVPDLKRVRETVDFAPRFKLKEIISGVIEEMRGGKV